MSKASLEDVSRVLAGLNQPEEVRRFLEAILTPPEAADVALRWELVKLLDQGVTQREIARRLGLSLCKITRGARELKREGSVFRQVLAHPPDAGD